MACDVVAWGSTGPRRPSCPPSASRRGTSATSRCRTDCSGTSTSRPSSESAVLKAVRSRAGTIELRPMVGPGRPPVPGASQVRGVVPSISRRRGLGRVAAPHPRPLAPLALGDDQPGPPRPRAESRGRRDARGRARGVPDRGDVARGRLGGGRLAGPHGPRPRRDREVAVSEPGDYRALALALVGSRPGSVGPRLQVRPRSVTSGRPMPITRHGPSCPIGSGRPKPRPSGAGRPGGPTPDTTPARGSPAPQPDSSWKGLAHAIGN